jgi:hypothetical protein
VDESTAAKTRKRRLLPGAAVQVASIAAFAWWRLPSNARDVHRLPKNIDAVSVVDLDRLQGMTGFAEHWKGLQSRYGLERLHKAGVDLKSLLSLTIGVRTQGMKLERVSLLHGAFGEADLSAGWKAELPSGQKAVTVGDITLYPIRLHHKDGWIYAGVLDDETLGYGALALLKDVISGDSSVGDNDALMSLIRSTASGDAAWGAAIYTDQLDKAVLVRGAAPPAVDWAGVSVTMRWSWGKESSARYELTFADKTTADKAAGRMIIAGSYGGGDVLFPALRVRSEAETGVTGRVMRIEVEDEENTPNVPLLESAFRF